jgi:hypothetical protein
VEDRKGTDQHRGQGLEAGIALWALALGAMVALALQRHPRHAGEPAERHDHRKHHRQQPDRRLTEERARQADRDHRHVIEAKDGTAEAAQEAARDPMPVCARATSGANTAAMIGQIIHPRRRGRSTDRTLPCSWFDAPSPC